VRLARTLPDACDILHELTKRNIKLNLAARPRRTDRSAS
jgi:hypothetical protein